MRRFAAVMNHRSAGFKANAMGVWAVPEDQLEEIGPQMAGFAAVSATATSARPTRTGRTPCSRWCTARTRTDCEATIAAIRDETGVDEYALLWSIKEYKKVRAPLLHRRVGRLARRAPRRRASSPPAWRRGERRPRSGAGARTTATAPVAMPPRRRRDDRDRRAPAGLRRRAASRRPRGSPPRWCARRASRAPAAGRSRRPTGARGRGRRSAGRRRRRSTRCGARARSSSSAGSGRHDRAAAASARASSALEPAVGRDVEDARDGRSSTTSASARDEVVDVHDLHRRRRAAHPQRRAAEQQARRQALAHRARGRAPARSVVTATAGVLVAATRSRRSTSAACTAGDEPRVGAQRRVLGERDRVVGPRAVHRRARDPDDLAARRPRRRRRARGACPRRSRGP